MRSGTLDLDQRLDSSRARTRQQREQVAAAVDRSRRLRAQAEVLRRSAVTCLQTATRLVHASDTAD